MGTTVFMMAARITARQVIASSIWGIPKLGYDLGGPHNKDCSIWGVYISAFVFRETTISY